MENRSNFKKIAAYAAAACFILVVGAGLLTYNMPSAYVSFDVNPSVEYTVNMYNRVISVKGVNDDGTQIINEIEIGSLNNKPIETAISMTVDEVARLGYLISEGAGIVITASSDNMQKADELAAELENAANEALEANNLQRSVSAEAVGKERVEEARELGVTPGKLNLVEKLKASAADPDSINVNDWLDKSVKDIMAKTKENREQNKEKDEKGEGTNNGNGKVKGNSETTEADSSAADSGNKNNNGNVINNDNNNGNENENDNLNGVEKEKENNNEDEIENEDEIKNKDKIKNENNNGNEIENENNNGNGNGNK